MASFKDKLINLRRGKILDFMSANNCWIHYDNFFAAIIAGGDYKSQFGQDFFLYN